MGDCLSNGGLDIPYELLKISPAKSFPRNCRSKCFITFLSKTSMVKYFLESCRQQIRTGTKDTLHHTIIQEICKMFRTAISWKPVTRYFNFL